MTTSIIRAGGTGVPGVQTTGGDDGALALKVGPLAATVEALNISSTGTGAFVGQVTATGFTGTLDGILGSGTPAAATVTTFTSNGIDDNADAIAITINSSEQVGIGTASPAYSLDVQGASAAFRVVNTAGSPNQPLALFLADMGTFNRGFELKSPSTDSASEPFRWATSNSVSWEIDTAEAMRINFNGNVGIGTASPAAKLSVVGEVTATGFTGTLDGILGSGTPAAATVTTIALSTGTSNGLSFIRSGSASQVLFKDTTSTDVVTLQNANGAALVFGTNAAEKMRIQSSGNVGIGTAAPYSQLDVYSTIASPTSGEASGVGTIRITNGATALTSAGGLEFKIAGDTNGYGTKIQALNSGGSQLVFANRNASATWTERMRINSAGNVGIGTVNTANARLQVIGAAGSELIIGNAGAATNYMDADTQIFRNASKGETMRITSAGKVGIGTAAPSQKFVVSNAGADNIVMAENSSAVIRMFMQAASASGSVGTLTNHVVQFLQNNQEKMRISTDGYVGIGTSNPTQSLTVSGAASRIYLINSNENINMDGSANGHLSLDGSGYAFGIALNLTGANLYTNSSSRSLIFGTDETERMTVSGAGTVNVVGTFTAGTKTFRIDHPVPSKTDTHYLLHSSIEGPQADLIYRGRADLVSGTVDVNIDTAAGMTEGTFNLLCGDVQCFTSNEDGWTALKGSVTGNVLTITAQDNTCTDTVSWMVIGERKDAKMIESEWADDNGKLIVETLKSEHK